MQFFPWIDCVETLQYKNVACWQMSPVSKSFCNKHLTENLWIPKFVLSYFHPIWMYFIANCSLLVIYESIKKMSYLFYWNDCIKAGSNFEISHIWKACIIFIFQSKFNVFYFFLAHLAKGNVRLCELLPSLGVRRLLTFHILIFSSRLWNPSAKWTETW